MSYVLRRHKLSAEAAVLSDREERIYTFLRGNPVGVLSTVTPNGDPHGVVIYYGVDKHFRCSFLTRKDTKKYDNIRYNDHVMLTVFEPLTQTVTQVLGRAAEVLDSREINRIAAETVAASVVTSENGLPPISKLQVGDYAAFTIKPVQIRMAVYARPDPGEYADLFESIESFDMGTRLGG